MSLKASFVYKPVFGLSTPKLYYTVADMCLNEAEGRATNNTTQHEE